MRLCVVSMCVGMPNAHKGGVCLSSRPKRTHVSMLSHIICTHFHTYIRTYVHTSVCVRMSSVCGRYHVRTYVHTCVCLLSRMILPMFPPCATVLYAYAHIRTYIRTYVCVCIYVTVTYLSVASPSFSTSFHSQHY